MSLTNTVTSESLTSAQEVRDFAHSIVATAREPLLVLDERLHVTFANQAFYSAFSVSPETTQGQFLYDLGNGQWDIPGLRVLLEEVVPQSTVVRDFPVTHTFPDIGTRNMILNARKIWQLGDHSALVLLAIEDITEQERMKTVARRHEQEFRLLVEGATDYAVFLISDEGTIQSWNAGAERIIGFTEAEIIGESLDRIFTPEDRAKGIPERELGLAALNGRADDKRWHLRKDNSRFFADGVMTRLVDEGGQNQGYAKILRDATARVRYEDSLREAEERLRLATDAAQVGTWDYFPITDELIWDERCKSFFGLSADDQVTYAGFLSGLHPDDVARSDRAVKEALRPEGPGTIDIVFRTLTGLDKENIRWIHWQGRARFNGEAQCERLIGTVQDVTQQKQLEQQLREAARKNERIAETLQKSLLLAPPPDTFPGISLKTFYESAWDDALIGGDFFDVFAVAENVVGVVVGDVTGKGLEAATYTAEIKFILRGFLRESGDPADALARLNRFVVDAERLDAAHLGSTYCAVSLACINTATGEIDCATAGAEPPLIFRAGSDVTDAVPTGGPMLGVAADLVYEAHSYQLHKGDLYVAYTDGLTEARRNKVFWGQEGLMEVIRETAFAQAQPLQVVADEVARQAKDWANGRQQDDVCLLLVRRL
ncbi:MAG: SpoIIE family protein phosphatase [Akkermansiaceae bacterium]|nr:SpoIIE family protein phosphatase [Armatimonadota bacterium]